MNPFALSLITFLVLVGGISRSAGQISTPEEREAVLAQTERFKVLQADSAADRFSGAADPFHSSEIEETVSPRTRNNSGDEPPEPPSDAEILTLLAEKIQPSGVMRFGDNAHLLFGERRVMAGEFISIQYQGQKYRLEVVEVDARTFVLRLNEELISKKIQ